MVRVGLVGLMFLVFCFCKKLATPLEFAESQLGVQEGSPSIRRYLLAAPNRQNVSEAEKLEVWQSGGQDRLFVEKRVEVVASNR